MQLSSKTSFLQEAAATITECKGKQSLTMSEYMEQAISLLQLLCMLINYKFLPYTVTTIFVLNKVPSSSSISSVCSRTSTTNLSKLGHSIKGNNSM